MKKYAILILSISFFAVCFIFTRIYEKPTEVFSQIVEKMGYDVLKEPYERVEFTIPEKFSPVYERYNNLLKEAGYDLSHYKGRKCTRYTYLIPSQNARANIIVCDGEVIGGDICSITLEGIMIPIVQKARTN
jgi:hypothetical protein